MPYMLSIELLRLKLRRIWRKDAIVAAALLLVLTLLFRPSGGGFAGIFVLVAVVQGFLTLRRTTKLRKDWQAYRILYYEDGLQLMKRGAELECVSREDVYGVDEQDETGLLVQGSDFTTLMFIPRELEHYDRLKRALMGWVSLGVEEGGKESREQEEAEESKRSDEPAEDVEDTLDVEDLEDVEDAENEDGAILSAKEDSILAAKEEAAASWAADAPALSIVQRPAFEPIPAITPIVMVEPDISAPDQDMRESAESELLPRADRLPSRRKRQAEKSASFSWANTLPALLSVLAGFVLFLAAAIILISIITH